MPCSFRVLDECDEMLNMGFVDDVEKILSQGVSDKVQTMLFSATLPSWVKSITARFLKKSHKTVDLVGTEKLKVSTCLIDLYVTLFTAWETVDDARQGWTEELHPCRTDRSSAML